MGNSVEGAWKSWRSSHISHLLMLTHVTADTARSSGFFFSFFFQISYADLHCWNLMAALLATEFEKCSSEVLLSVGYHGRDWRVQLWLSIRNNHSVIHLLSNCHFILDSRTCLLCHTPHIERDLEILPQEIYIQLNILMAIYILKMWQLWEVKQPWEIWLGNSTLLFSISL